MVFSSTLFDQLYATVFQVDEQPPVSPTEEGPPQTRELPSHSTKTPSDNYMSRFVKNDTFLITRPRFLKLLLWLILWGLFIELEFGSVFFIVSLFYIVYTSMASGTRNKEELSAYSVFNPNCERIDGTFTTEQFEKELRYGALAVH